MQYFKGLFCILFFLSFFTACENSQSASSNNLIFGNFYIRYLATDNMVQAEAKFKEGLTFENAVSKKFEKSVFFQDGAMAFEDLTRQKVSILRYNTRRKKPFAEKYTFKYEDDQGTTQEHQVSMSPIKNYTIKDALKKSNENTLSWEGTPLSANESLVLIIHDVDNKAVSIKINGPSPSSEIKIPGKKISTLANGTGGLDLIKKQISKSKNNQLSTISTIEYYAKGIVVEVME